MIRKQGFTEAHAEITQESLFFATLYLPTLILDERLAFIADHIHEQPEVCIRYFVPDERKNGGAIVEVSGQIYRISNADATITLADGCNIRLSDLVDLSIG